MPNAPVQFRAAIITSGASPSPWRDSLEEVVAEYLALPLEQRALSRIETTKPVLFDDALPPRTALNPSMIEKLAERLVAEGRLDESSTG